MRPAIGSVHRIVWHPQNGDVGLSRVYVTVRAVSQAGCMVQPVGLPVLQVDWEQWRKMIGEVAAVAEK